jgi:hypothetical protein
MEAILSKLVLALHEILLGTYDATEILDVSHLLGWMRGESE